MLVEYFINMIPINITNKIHTVCLIVTDFVYIYQQELHDRLQYQMTGYSNNTYIEK